MLTSSSPFSGLRRIVVYAVGAVVLTVTGIGVGVLLPLSHPLWEVREVPATVGELVAPFAPAAAPIAPLPPVDTADLPFAIIEGGGESADRGSAHWLSGVGLSVFSQTLSDGAALLQRPNPRAPIRWSVIAAGGDVIGERLTSALPAPASASVSGEGAAADSATWFVNVTSGEVFPASALLAKEKEAALTRLLTEALAHPLPGPVPTFRPPFDDLSFAPDGALIVTLPRPHFQADLKRVQAQGQKKVPDRQGGAGNEEAESASAVPPKPSSTADPFITIRIRPEVTDALLSPVGQGIRHAVSAQVAPGGAEADHPASDHGAPGETVIASAFPSIPLHPYPLARGPEPTEASQLIGALPTEDVDCEQAQCVALTFDDGPDPALTPRLLDILFRERVHATFFLQGDAAVKHPTLIVRALREGHTLGTHTWSHPRLPFLPAEAARQEIVRAKDVVIGATGRTPILMRPPYGEFSSRVLSTLRSTGDAVIMWNVDTEDWKNKSVPETTRRALEGSRPGSIILMHDVHPTSIESVPGIIQGLRDRGFSLVSVPTLLGPVTPGSVYYGRS